MVFPVHSLLLYVFFIWASRADDRTVNALVLSRFCEGQFTMLCYGSWSEMLHKADYRLHSLPSVYVKMYRPLSIIHTHSQAHTCSHTNTFPWKDVKWRLRKTVSSTCFRVNSFDTMFQFYAGKSESVDSIHQVHLIQLFFLPFRLSYLFYYYYFSRMCLSISYVNSPHHSACLNGVVHHWNVIVCHGDTPFVSMHLAFSVLERIAVLLY